MADGPGVRARHPLDSLPHPTAPGSFDGASLSDEGVHVLDPFTGTGTFVTRLIQSGFIKPDDLDRKFTEELHG